MATIYLWHVVILASYVMVLVTSKNIEVPIEGTDAEKTKAKRGDGSCEAGGRIFRNGEVFSYPGNSHCIKYRCDNGYYHLVQAACERKSQCIALHSVHQDGCRSLRCVKERRGNHNVYYMEPTVQDQCEVVRGRCVRKDQNFVHNSDCQTYRCEATPHGGYRFAHIPGMAKCKDDYGNCINVGGRFSKRINGRYYRNCVCLSGGNTQCRG